MTDTRNEALTYAAGDVLSFLAPIGTVDPGAPGTVGAPRPLDPSKFWCLGWLDTNGSIFSLKNTNKDIMAAGSMDPIRTIKTAAAKTFEATYLEAVNPVVRALYDDVPVGYLQPAPGTSVASYVIDSTPRQNLYVAVFDSIDPTFGTRMRAYCPNVMVTGRGNDQQEQNDITMLQLTFSLYRGQIGAQFGAVKRYIDYGEADISAYFDTSPPE